MANVTITESNVRLASNQARVKPVTFGETVLKGETVYIKATDNKAWKADASSFIESVVYGQAIVGGNANDVGIVAADGSVSVGVVLTAGVTYYQSATPGKICLRSDLVSGDYITPVGTASTTSVLQLGIGPTKIPVP